MVSRDNDIEENGLELDFSTDFEVLGKVEHHDLKEGGADIKVTEENKTEYIEYVIFILTFNTMLLMRFRALQPIVLKNNSLAVAL